jgi:hypothetical protein
MSRQAYDLCKQQLDKKLPCLLDWYLGMAENIPGFTFKKSQAMNLKILELIDKLYKEAKKAGFKENEYFVKQGIICYNEDTKIAYKRMRSAKRDAWHNLHTCYEFLKQDKKINKEQQKEYQKKETKAKKNWLAAEKEMTDNDDI